MTTSSTMSDCWEFCRPVARAALVTAAFLLFSPLPVAGGTPGESPGESKDTISAIFNEYKSPPPRTIPAAPAEADSLYHEFQVTQDRNRVISTSLLIGAALAAHIILLSILRKKPTSTSDEILFGTGLIYIVFGTILLVILSDNKDQLTASTGILGAIAGYLFGAASRRGRGEEAKSQQT